MPPPDPRDDPPPFPNVTTDPHVAESTAFLLAFDVDDDGEPVLRDVVRVDNLDE